MKLSALNTAIRTKEGPPKIQMRFTDGAGTEIILTDLEVTKQSLIAALAARFPGGRGAETGLYLDRLGYLSREGTEHSEPDDGVEDLLGGGDDGMDGLLG